MGFKSVVSESYSRSDGLSLAGSNLRAVGQIARAFTDSPATLSDGIITARTYRSKMPTALSFSNGRALFVNQYIANSVETVGPNKFYIRFAWEYPANTLYPVLFGGRSEIRLEPGDLVLSPQFPLDLPGGITPWMRTFVRVDGVGDKWPVGGPNLDGTTEWWSPTDMTATISGTTHFDQIPAYGPTAIFAPNVAASVGAMGDSIPHGYGDTPRYYGFVQRAALANNLGFASCATDGERAQLFSLPAAHRMRMRLLAGCQHIVSLFGTNDLSQSRTAAQIESDLVACWAAINYQGAKGYACTIPPRSTSTDGYATVGNQTTVASNAVRLAVNNWLRGGAPLDSVTKTPVAVGTGGAITCDYYDSTKTKIVTGTGGHYLTAIFETADTVESARDSGLWKAPNYASSDGIHPASTGHIAMAGCIVTSLFT